MRLWKCRRRKRHLKFRDMEKNECGHLYGEVVEVLPSEIHKVMAGSDFPLLLYKCSRCGQFFKMHGFNFRHANAEEIKHFKELDSKDKFYKMEECKPISSVKQELIDKACNVYADLLSAHGYNPIDVNNEVVRMKKELEE